MASFKEKINFVSSDNFTNSQNHTNDDDLISNFSTLPTIKNIEDQLIKEALLRAKNNQSIAANMLGITRQALNKRLIRKRELWFAFCLPLL